MTPPAMHASCMMPRRWYAFVASAVMPCGSNLNLCRACACKPWVIRRARAHAFLAGRATSWMFVGTLGEEGGRSTGEGGLFVSPRESEPSVKVENCIYDRQV
ncbi:unnamed protein product [Ectocarpus fasciculatus]